MAQTVHPLDDELVDFEIVKSRLIRLLSRDQGIGTEEREVIAMLHRIHAGVGTYRAREVAADAYKRNGNTRHTQARFREAGDRIVSLEEVRNARKIVTLFPEEDYAG